MKSIALILITILTYISSHSQENGRTINLKIIKTTAHLEETILLDSNKSFVQIKDFIPTIELDIKYATNQNVFYRKLYSRPSALIRLPVAKALKNVQEDLFAKGIGLKIYDAYRPYTVTCKMFEILPDTIYMGLPWKGSKHNKGISLDLTLIDFKTRKELPMPTPFDALVYASHPNFKLLPENVIQNRDLLIHTMSKFGFVVDPVEWWHFNYNSDTNFELIDIPHSEIENLILKLKLKR